MKNFVPCQSVRNELNQLPDSRYTYIKTKHDTYYTHTPTYIHLQTRARARAHTHTHTRCSTRDTQVHSYRHREVKSKWVEDEEKKGRGGK